MRHETVFEVAFRAGGDAAHATDAVRVTHKVGVGHIDVHRACAGALSALSALLRIAPDAEDAQHAEESLARASGAEIVAEGAIDEKGEQQEKENDAAGQSKQLSVPHHGKVPGPLQQPDDDSHRQQQVEDVAAQLQVALDALWHSQPGQVQQPSQLRHPVLRCTQLADPPAEEYAEQQNAGQHPLAHVFRVRGETEHQPRHEENLYAESQNLNFAPFCSHIFILSLLLLRINLFCKIALFFQKVAMCTTRMICGEK